MVYLSSSKFSLAVLGNLGFALALATYKIVLRASPPLAAPAAAARLPSVATLSCPRCLVVPSVCQRWC